MKKMMMLSIMVLAAVGMLQPAHAREFEQDESWRVQGDLMLRGDRVTRLPGDREVERVGARLRLGADRRFGDFEFSAAARVRIGSDSNRDNRANLDNERSNAVGVDTLRVSWLPGPDRELVLGKSRMAMELSPMVWDSDLRPMGVSYAQDWEIRDFDRLRLVALAAAGQHLYGDRSRLYGAQVAWHIREGAPSSGALLFSLLRFERLQTLVDQGLARTNRRVGGRLISDYELLDLQGMWSIDVASRPLQLRVNLLRNLGASDKRDGARLSLRYGQANAPGEWEFGYAVQRVQRDAVMAAFSDDDWWFPSAVRGHMPWLAVGLPDAWQLRAAGFVERRDDLSRSTHRVIVDVTREW